MTTDAFKQIILEHLHFSPTADQRGAMDEFVRFIAQRDGMPAMLMRGSAGTGKTSLVAAMVKSLLQLKQKVILMAPTGRAAKVLALSSDTPATTIHRKIYRQKSLGGDFSLDINLHADTLFIVDEASMISTEPQVATAGMPMFLGNGGGLIDDLVTYVYSGKNCRLMLIGDTAQLPPIGEDEAPALQKGVMECYGLNVYEYDIMEVVRQKSVSGILWNANQIRFLITHDSATELPKIKFSGFADIVVVPGSELIESLEDSYYRMGVDDTVVITRSNKRATIYNNGIRTRVLDHEDALTSGDRIMIVKNHYFEEENPPMPFIANGDLAVVQRVRNTIELYGFTFADLTLSFPDYDDVELTMTAILDCLQTDSPALTTEQQKQLYDGVMEDYSDLPRKDDRLKALKNDIYYTALQVKFAYAVTCHKAQGGQWGHVYIDQGYMTDDMLTPDYIHWLYTAFTRASEKLFLVNWPKEQIKED